ncbi:hypothetical protein PRZ48_012697 [Zasmidium cellare]|uniref:Uncharacterized protein n=1 Tax=Zasmidium cellare TaxID=395010 RepID=A0ABR0E5K3_ZASCE|nr:hypothetical protein PRZ48_012697 [Zasmidium cellare]
MGWLAYYQALENVRRQSAVRRAQIAEASTPSPEPLEENATVKPKDTSNVLWRPKKVICFDRRDGRAFVVEINDSREGLCSGQAPKPAHSDVEDSDIYRSALIRYLKEEVEELWSGAAKPGSSSYLERLGLRTLVQRFVESYGKNQHASEQNIDPVHHEHSFKDFEHPRDSANDIYDKMARASLAQPQAYCWLSFLVGAMINMSLTMTDWINEEMDIGHKIFMGAECVTVASALLPKVLDRKLATSLLPK